MIRGDQDGSLSGVRALECLLYGPGTQWTSCQHECFDGGCLAGQLTFSTGLGRRFKDQRQGLLGAGGIGTRVEACPQSISDRVIERSSGSAGPAEAVNVQHLSQKTVGREHNVTASCPDAAVLIRRGLEVARTVTEASPSSRALRERSPRWVATRTAPGLLPTILATWATSSPATTRRMIISACSRGSVAMNARAASVDMPSRAFAAVSSGAGRSRRSMSAVGRSGCLVWYRCRSITRRRATVKSQPRNSSSLPRNRGIRLATSSHTSLARSSAASPADSRR